MLSIIPSNFSATFLKKIIITQKGKKTKSKMLFRIPKPLTGKEAKTLSFSPMTQLFQLHHPQGILCF